MRRALELAARGLGWVEPNPMVGAVIARGGRLIAEGYHRRFGGPHAEVEAIEAAGTAGRAVAGAEMYVSLEPCCHTGKTPPCTEAIRAAGIRRVFIAMADPYQQVAGRGIAALRAAGMGVEVGLCGEAAAELNAPFIKRVRTGLPWVIAKWAQTVDGAIATPTGDSRWISGEASRRLVHRLRGRVDVIACGIGTALADDPQLTARDVDPRRTARRLVFDPQLRLPDNAKLLDDLPAVPLTLAVSPEVIAAAPPKLKDFAARGVELLPLGRPDSQGDGPWALRPVFEALVERHGVTNVLIEGGGRLMGSLYRQGLIDQCLVFIAPKLMGCADAIGAVRGLRCERAEALATMRLQRTCCLGDDVLLDYRT